jgi:hypothetical protein
MLGKNWSNLQSALQPKRKAELVDAKAVILKSKKSRKRLKKLKPLERVHRVRPGVIIEISPAAPPSVQMEITRCLVVKALGQRFEQLCVEHLRSRKPWVHFEAWLWACRSSNPSGDPVLPQGEARDYELERKLECAGASPEAARVLCRDLLLASTQLTNQLAVPSPTKEKVVCSVSTELVELGLGDFSLTLSPCLYEKMCHLLHLHGCQAGQGPLLLACLARYHAMAGCHPRAGGMQAAIPSDVFDVLEQDFGVSMECFASPMNCNWPNFCSAFKDTDQPFGSLGNFLDFVPSTALSLEANPPFDAQIITLMTAHMERLLQAKIALSFTVIIPCWEHVQEPLKVQAWQGLLNSRFCRHHLQLAQADHAFTEGSQLAQYHVANTDTSVFFLQNAAGHKLWSPTSMKLTRLQRAFRLRSS